MKYVKIFFISMVFALDIFFLNSILLANGINMVLVAVLLFWFFTSLLVYMYRLYKKEHWHTIEDTATIPLETYMYMVKRDKRYEEILEEIEYRMKKYPEEYEEWRDDGVLSNV